MSSASSVNDALSGYVAGRVTAEQLVGVVAAAYYGEGGRGKREGLRPLMDVVERAHPGFVDLSGTATSPGFVVKLASRPFPKQFEAELRVAAQQALGSSSTLPPSPIPLPGLFTRILRAIRNVFSA